MKQNRLYAQFLAMGLLGFSFIGAAQADDHPAPTAPQDVLAACQKSDDASQVFRIVGDLGVFTQLRIGLVSEVASVERESGAAILPQQVLFTKSAPFTYSVFNNVNVDGSTKDAEPTFSGGSMGGNLMSIAVSTSDGVYDTYNCTLNPKLLDLP
ncbi:MAG: hypothetical protein P4M08_14230 [Oligoflexia bacterium]|nr:hypothetical protein [Oligoflexia bacterium]